jgi:hypothetical protein
VLLPLVHAPLLEYTLEWLALNRVEEVGGSSSLQQLVCCCAAAG